MEIKSINEWNELKKSYKDKFEIIILKFSPVCPVSRNIEYSFDQWCKENNILDSERVIVKINVIASRELSNHIAEEFQLKHESPQLLWLDKSLHLKVFHNHYKINEDNLNKHL